MQTTKDNNIAVRAQGVSKKFCKTLKHTMMYGASDIGRNMLGMKSGSEKLRDGEFWALDDLSFELKKGEVLGVIGANGSGKTTLLKVLTGILMPDRGRLEINGRIGGLIAVGAGFHPMLSGRQNIYINGSILGLSKKEIDDKFEEIVDFADIGDFLDTPVKYYSSGMHVRLGFAIAAYAMPEILVVDEVLAVGDARFRKKCLGKMDDVTKNNGRTILFVSHSMPAIRQLCKKTILLDKGKIVMVGPTKEVLEKYLVGESKNNEELERILPFTNKEFTLNKFLIRQHGKDCNYIDSDNQFEIIIDFDISEDIDLFRVGVGIKNFSGETILKTLSSDWDYTKEQVRKGKYIAIFKFPDKFLGAGNYIVELYASRFGKINYLAKQNISKLITISLPSKLNIARVNESFDSKIILKNEWTITTKQ